MTKNIYGGGSQTNVHGLKFEQETDLHNALIQINGYSIQNNFLYFNGQYIGIIASKNNLYKLLLEPNKIDYSKIISKKLLPDEAIYLDNKKAVFIIEKEFQNVSGSVDEKLQTCGFKKSQYTKLFAPLGIRVEYLYILNQWFTHPQYKDVLEFIIESNCYYFFNEIPLDFLGLPHIDF